MHRQGAGLPRPLGRRRRNPDRGQRLERRLGGIRAGARRPRHRGDRARLRRGAAGGDRRRARPLRHHGRCRRQLRFLPPRAVSRKAARRLRPRDRQPLRGRHRPRRHAVPAPLSRQSRAQPDRADVLPLRHPGFPLRPARPQPRRHPCARPADLRHGVRERDGGARRAQSARPRRGADHARGRTAGRGRRICGPGRTAGATCASS